MQINRQFNGVITRRLARLALNCGLLLLMAGSALAQQVSVDFDKGVDFSQYKTYAWGTGTPAANPLVHQRIVAGIEAQLAAKGLRKAESNPDLIVLYHAATDTQVSINTMGGGPFGGWRWGTGTATVDKIPVGQLAVNIGDPSAKKFVWRGTASGTISSKQEKNEKALNSALTKMFQNFPNPPGKK
ncbi:MAG: DUF4136 domain-containing protein [Verrucomicrobiales bacterium]|nr:DUF4136 domain-containing protein [Verrucomicrobiales bacterium]